MERTRLRALCGVAACDNLNMYVPAAGCFLFSIENPRGDAPALFECRDEAKAMYCHASWGPCFGQDDIGITDSGASSRTDFPTSYLDAKGRGWITFTTTGPVGFSYFTPDDYEVWSVSS